MVTPGQSIPSGRVYLWRLPVVFVGRIPASERAGNSSLHARKHVPVLQCRGDFLGHDHHQRGKRKGDVAVSKAEQVGHE
jgi:hypothetical protein